MGNNIIVSEDTLRSLLEAHASLCAWYYELWSALRAANASAHAPDDAAREAFVEQLAATFPELAAIARSIHTPRLFVPPPPAVGPPSRRQPAKPDDPTTEVEPALTRKAELGDATTEPAVQPPPLVVPSKVNYEP